MPCSEKKRLSNQKNALKSTGPRSVPGKARVALNAVKHGLRADHLILPGKDAAAFDQMLGAWMGDWNPTTEARRVLVEQAAAHAWRLRRCLKAERQHLIGLAREQVRDRRREAEARARRVVERLGDDPAAALEQLLADRAGAEQVLALWRKLAADASPRAWRDRGRHHGRLLHLLGLDDRTAKPAAIGGAVLASLRLVERAEARPHANPWRTPPVDPQADAEDAARAAELSAFLNERLAEVVTYIAAHFGPAEAAAQAEEALAPASVVLDDSDEGPAPLRRPTRPRLPRHPDPARQADEDRGRRRRGRAGGRCNDTSR